MFKLFTVLVLFLVSSTGHAAPEINGNTLTFPEGDRWGIYRDVTNSDGSPGIRWVCWMRQDGSTCTLEPGTYTWRHNIDPLEEATIIIDNDNPPNPEAFENFSFSETCDYWVADAVGGTQLLPGGETTFSCQANCSFDVERNRYFTVSSTCETIFEHIGDESTEPVGSSMSTNAGAHCSTRVINDEFLERFPDLNVYVFVRATHHCVAY